MIRFLFLHDIQFQTAYLDMKTSSRTLAFILTTSVVAIAQGEDTLRQMQITAIQRNHSPVAHWGYDSSNYTMWGAHSNRLIPVYTFGTLGAGPGLDLKYYTGTNSVYRNEQSLRRIYGYLPDNTLCNTAEYMDQTNIYDLQVAAAANGKKHIFLVVFDGMDWTTTRAAAIYNSKRVGYQSGRGSGTHMQDYSANGTSQFAYMVTSPHDNGTTADVNQQRIVTCDGELHGGYDPARGGPNPWTQGNDPQYVVSLPKNAAVRHAYTDSSCGATSMTTGIKTFNGAVNVDPLGRPIPTIAHQLQERAWAVGTVTSVPFCHATPAAAYAQNVDRNDYQDLSRDMLGLASIAHPRHPLPGLDVVIGCGYGVDASSDSTQGSNFVAGNKYLTESDMHRIDARNGGRYIIAPRTSGLLGSAGLRTAALHAIRHGKRLFGFYGTLRGNLPLQTADGDFQPVPGRKGEYIEYGTEDIKENPTLADMTAAAISVVEQDPDGFWLMIEAGDVDWANHDNNLDASIGAVNSGDAAVKVVTDWVERASNWQETLLIVTADHGHYLVLDKPELLSTHY